MTKANKIVALAGLAALFALMHKRVLAGEGVLSLENVRNLARQAIQIGDMNVPVERLVRIAWIESQFDPSASRWESHINDMSTGIAQTLLGTARWLAKDMGYTAYGVPSSADLASPQVSLYFGAAYLDWLSRYKGKSRSEEWIVRSYNGGPGHTTAGTNAYWQKYLKAISEVG